MRRDSRSRVAAAGVLAILTIAPGCASSPPSRFYTLSAISSAAASSSPVAAEGTVVAVGPVTIPVYLDRPQIVTRTSDNELALAEYERWAGSLREDLTTVVAEDLAELLNGHGATAMRAGAVGQRPGKTKYRVVVDILRFEAASDGTVTLKAQWAILGDDASKDPTFVADSTTQETAQGKDYASYVAAMSRALASLSREITAALTTKVLAR